MATEAALPGAGPVVPGTYVIDDPFPLRVSMTLGEGWTVWSGITSDGTALYKVSADPPNGRGFAVVVVDDVYRDPCNRAAGNLDPELGPGVDDLATALAGQPHTEASEITDVTLGGYSGKYLEYTFSSTDSACSRISRFPTVNGPREAIQNERDQVWILDVDGVRLMIDIFSFPGATESDVAEVREIVESMRIEP